ncbi:helix-turn-helix domain-containing protein [Plantactinospora sp. CA-290183]|uniref:helix-turn-helix domain-containing protein n=1 Tax=Plantactinospora sp. CA-290183 TaxID=3240006 RepID=UPI003D8ACEF7
MEEFGQMLRRLRRERGLSLRRFAEIAGIDFGYVGQIERGERRCSPDWAEICDQTLSANGALVAAYQVDTRAAGDDMQRRTVLMALALGASTPAVAVEAIRQWLDTGAGTGPDEWQLIANDYARDFYVTAPATLVGQLGMDLAVLQPLIGAEPGNRDLLRSAGQLAVIMAMALTSTGQVGLARRWWRTARRQADQSGDLDTRIWVRDWEVVNGTYERRPVRQILDLADETITMADGRACCGTAGVLSGRAQALAAVGRVEEATVAIRAVEEITDRLPGPVINDAESMLGWPEVRLRYTESYVYTFTGQVTKAMTAQDRALELYPADLARERAQLQMHRANCLVRSGQIPDGLRYATEVLDELPADRHNALLYEVARQVVAVVPERERRRAEVAELRDRLAAQPAR